MNKKYYFLIIVFILIAASYITYGRILDSEFEFINLDDPNYITENQQIKSGINWESIKWAFTTTYFTYWHPLTWISHMLDWSLFGAYAPGHHLFSLLLHMGTMLFLFFFLNKATNNIWLSAFTAALFALHPLRVESIAWAAERKDVLSMFFGMAALYAYAFYAESSKLSKYLLCLIFFALSLMSKPIMVTLPFVLMLLDYWPLGRWGKALSTSTKNRYQLAGKLVWEKAPFILLTIASSIFTFRASENGNAIRSLELISISERFSNAVVSYVSYLAKTFWPVNLAVFYPYDLPIPLWEVLISGIILMAITFTVLYYIKKLPFLFVGWFWYLGTLVPVIGLVQAGSQSMADRHTYLPSIGIDVMLTWGIPFLIKNKGIRKKILFPSGIIFLAILSFVTWHQCGYWKNSIELFSHALKVTKNNALAYNNRGVSYLLQGNKELGCLDAQKACEIGNCRLLEMAKGKGDCR